MINKSATKIGTLEFTNGNRNTLWLGHNRNTGAAIVWQQMPGRRSERFTGKRIALLNAEITRVVALGEAAWVDLNPPAAMALVRIVREG